MLPDGRVIVESLAIIEYLNEKYPTPNNFYPGDAVQRAQIRAFNEIINSGIHPFHNMKLLDKVEEDFKADRFEWAKFWVTKGAGIVE